MLILLIIIGMATPAFAAQRVGDWVVQEQESAIDGSETIRIFAGSNDAILVLETRIVGGEARRDRPRVVMSGVTLWKGETNRIRYNTCQQRLPHGPLVASVSNAQKEGFDLALSPSTFIRQLIDCERIAFQIITPRRTYPEVVLNIRGLREAMERRKLYRVFGMSELPIP